MQQFPYIDTRTPDSLATLFTPWYHTCWADNIINYIFVQSQGERIYLNVPWLVGIAYAIETDISLCVFYIMYMYLVVESSYFIDSLTADIWLYTPKVVILTSPYFLWLKPCHNSDIVKTKKPCVYVLYPRDCTFAKETPLWCRAVCILEQFLINLSTLESFGNLIYNVGAIRRVSCVYQPKRQQ